MLLGCGAPTKSAGDVSSIFKSDVKQLDQKLFELCSEMSARSSQPSLVGLSFGPRDCNRAGLHAMNFRKDNQFNLVNTGTQRYVEDTKTLSIRVRTQGYLNTSLVGLAASLSSAMKRNAGQGIGAINISNRGGQGLGSLINLSQEYTEKPTFNPDDFAFSMKIRMKGSDIVDLDNQIAISGRIIDKNIAVTILTTDNPTAKQSFMKSAKIVVLIVPHAKDLYGDIFFDVSVYKVDSLIDDSIKQNLNNMISSLAKQIFNAVLAIEKDE